MSRTSGPDRAGSPFAGKSRKEAPARSVWERGVLARAKVFFSETVWREDRPRRGPRALLWRAARIAHLAVRGFLRDQCVVRASALTYITVLSLIPLLAFTFSIAKGFGIYKKLVGETVVPFLERSLAQSPEMRDAMVQVLGRVDDLVENTRFASLGTFGLLILGWAVIKLLGTIERSFNQIWGVHRSRSLLRKVSDYLTMVIVTPVFLFVAGGITTAALGSSVTEILRERLHLGPLLDLGIALLPLLSLWLGFTFIYMAMPNARTRFTSAVLGAVVGGSLWQLTLLLHIKFQIGVANYSAIYSSFAAIPIFLVWVQLSWVMVLFGAEVCFAHQSEPSYLRVARSRPADHAFKEIVALRAMARIGQRFLSGGPAWTSDGLGTELAVPVRSLEEVLDALVSQGLLAVAPDEREDVFLPARDLDAITVKTVIDALKGTTGPVDLPPRTRADHRIDKLLATLDQEVAGSRSNLTIRSLALAVAREEAEDRETREAASGEAGSRTGPDELGVRAGSP